MGKILPQRRRDAERGDETVRLIAVSSQLRVMGHKRHKRLVGMRPNQPKVVSVSPGCLVREDRHIKDCLIAYSLNRFFSR